MCATGHTINGTYLCSVCKNPYNIGDIGQGGGIIFYRNSIGFDFYTGTGNTKITAYYLEAAPSNLGNFAWTSQALADCLEVDGTETAIGTGKRNTLLILSLDSLAPAALECNKYSNNGVSGWFLPSRDEILELYKHYAANGKGSYANLTPTGYYWTSEQVASGGGQNHRTNAYGSNFGGNGSSSNRGKNNTDYVRAIRAF